MKKEKSLFGNVKKPHAKKVGGGLRTHATVPYKPKAVFGAVKKPRGPKRS